MDEGDNGIDVGSKEFMALPPEEQIKALAERGMGQEWLQVSARERDDLVAELKRVGHWRE